MILTLSFMLSLLFLYRSSLLDEVHGLPRAKKKESKNRSMKGAKWRKERGTARIGVLLAGNEIQKKGRGERREQNVSPIPNLKKIKTERSQKEKREGAE